MNLEPQKIMKTELKMSKEIMKINGDSNKVIQELMWYSLSVEG